MAFSVLRVPFFLEPGYDESKPFIETNRERLIHKWGGKRGWEVQKQRHDLKGRGLEAGISHFNLDRLAANTMASHRLIQHIGKTYGLAVSEAIYDLLNQYYFVDGHSLNDKPRLAKVVAARMQELMPTEAPTKTELLDFLNGDEGREQIMHALHALNQLGIHSIPKFIIEGRTVVDGAARSDTFVEIFREIEARGVVQGTAIFNDVLGVSDEIVEKGSHLPPTSMAA
ncbi:DSBA oxidoreductase [Nitzschia inconspicua]|uniref:DSBA oxidoreductase n=1 Tax=Nitzschia inconspicua TaxID=303405 RepID=A0A9K3KM03_9STRA|nr:DSBA oxidoreductase [Nitzschia inconspicua]